MAQMDLAIRMAKPHHIESITDALLDLVIPMTVGDTPLLIGLSGAQGCGKTTSTQMLKRVMGDDVVVLALDDFYFTLAERQTLAKKVSPLFETRGVPATHDIALLERTIARLQNADKVRPVSIPIFSKPLDDRLPKSEWVTVTKTPRLILVEGWCIGATLPPSFADSAALNTVESQDVDNAWRNYQAKILKNEYAQLWAKFDAFIHIRAPKFDFIKNWRIEQEADNLGVPKGQLPQDRIAWVEDFIQYYQRITEAMIAGHHENGSIINIDALRRVTSVTT